MKQAYHVGGVLAVAAAALAFGVVAALFPRTKPCQEVKVEAPAADGPTWQVFPFPPGAGQLTYALPPKRF